MNVQRSDDSVSVVILVLYLKFEASANEPEAPIDGTDRCLSERIWNELEILFPGIALRFFGPLLAF